MPLYMHNSRLLKIDGALAVGGGCCCNPPPDPPDGGGGFDRCAEYLIEAKWQGLTFVYDKNYLNDPAVCSADPCGKFEGGTVDAYRLGVFRWEYFGRIRACSIGSWTAFCAPIGSPFPPPAQECNFACSCLDLALDPPEACGGNPADAEYTFTGYVVTVYDPAATNCYNPASRAWPCEFGGGMRVFKYTCVLLASETDPTGGPKSFKDATVEEVLYPQPPTYDPAGPLGAFIACAGHPATEPTVRLYFPVP